MTLVMKPVIGNWYQNMGGNNFEIVALDQSLGLIEIQYFDGTVEEIDLESWYEQNFIAIAPPEDWSGSLDIDKQDYGVDLEETSHLIWENPLDTLDAQD